MGPRIANYHIAPLYDTSKTKYITIEETNEQTIRKISTVWQHKLLIDNATQRKKNKKRDL